MCHSRDNAVDWEGEVLLCLVVIGDVIASVGVDFSECSSLTYDETCVVRCSEGDEGAGDRNVTKFIQGSNGYVEGSLKRAEVLAGLFTNRRLVTCMLSWDDHFFQIARNVSGTQVQTAAVCSL